METKNFSNQKIAIYYEHFSSKTISELIDLFNAQVGLKAWVGERAYYLEALIRSIKARGICVDAIYTEYELKLDKKVRLYDNTLVTE